MLGTALPFVASGQNLPEAISPADFVDGGNPDPDKVELGKLLFFDPILSGNRNISCATCHHPLLATGDGLSLPVGEGGRGLGPLRSTGDEVGEPIAERVPRNAPPVFALGHNSVRVLFHDGRVQFDDAGNLIGPSPELPLHALDNILAVQAMLPVTSTTEMRGQPGENDAADAPTDTALWELLADRVAAIPEYATLFGDVFGIPPGEIEFSHIANAIAAFEIDAWRSTNTGYDRFMRGERHAMSRRARRGMRFFFGRAGCSGCHSGPMFSDMQFHAIGVPQVGPGKGNGPDGHDDFGRSAISGDEADLYRFRTPPLRNVAFTGPYMHDGAFATLGAAVRHHLRGTRSLRRYRCGIFPAGQLVMPPRGDLNAIDCRKHDDRHARRALTAANELPRTRLNRREFRQLLAFLVEGLSDFEQIEGLADDLPKGCRVPSGLPVDGCSRD